MNYIISREIILGFFTQIFVSCCASPPPLVWSILHFLCRCDGTVIKTQQAETVQDPSEQWQSHDHSVRFHSIKFRSFHSSVAFFLSIVAVGSDETQFLVVRNVMIFCCCSCSSVHPVSSDEKSAVHATSLFLWFTCILVNFFVNAHSFKVFSDDASYTGHAVGMYIFQWSRILISWFYIYYVTKEVAMGGRKVVRTFWSTEVVFSCIFIFLYR